MLLNKELPKEEIKMTSANIFFKESNILSQQGFHPSQKSDHQKCKGQQTQASLLEKGVPFHTVDWSVN